MQILSKIHKLKESVKKDLFCISLPEEIEDEVSKIGLLNLRQSLVCNRHNIETFLETFDTIPLFIVDDYIIDMIKDMLEDASFIGNLIENNLFHLPYPKIALQYIMPTLDGSRGKDTVFSILSEYDNIFNSVSFELSTNDKAAIHYNNFDFRFIKRDNWLLEDIPNNNNYVTQHLFNNDLKEKFKKHEIRVNINSIIIALFMTFTKGIDKSVNSFDKLNKARIKQGKTLIKEYITVSIKSYFDRDGNEHAFDSRKPVKLHWRRGHIRGVRYGKGKELIKKMWIHPVLVNYDPSIDKPSFSVYKV